MTDEPILSSRNLRRVSNHYSKMGENGLAVLALDAAHQLLPESSTHRLLAGLLEKCGYEDEAFEALEHHRHLWPESYPAGMMLASRYVKRGMPDKAIGVLNDLMKDNEKAGQCVPLMMKALCHVGEPEAAIRYGEFRLIEHPRDAYTRSALIAAYTDAGRLDHAIDFGLHTAEIQPGNVAAKTGLMFAYIVYGEPRNALIVGEDLMQRCSHEDFPHLFKHMAMAHLALNHDKMANNFAQRILEYLPDNKFAHCVAAGTYMKLGDVKAAKTHADAVLANNPGNRYASILRMALGLVEGNGEAVIAVAEKAHAMSGLNDMQQLLKSSGEELVANRPADEKRHKCGEATLLFQKKPKR